jgi:hypothetical protein
MNLLVNSANKAGPEPKAISTQLNKILGTPRSLSHKFDSAFIFNLM